MFQQMKGGGGGGGKSWGKGNGGGHSRDRSTTVWIGNVPEGLTKEEIEENFKQAGTVKYCSLGKGGTGKVEYSTAAEAKQAISMFNGTEINGATLHVDPWTGGGSGGASGGSGGESAGE